MLSIRTQLTNGSFDDTLRWLYGGALEAQRSKYAGLIDAFESAFGAVEPAALFSAPAAARLAEITRITSSGACLPRR